MVTCTGQIGIHEGRTDGRTDVYDVMAIKPNFLTSMGYHVFLTMMLRARSSPMIGTGVIDHWNLIKIKITNQEAQISSKKEKKNINLCFLIG